MEINLKEFSIMTKETINFNSLSKIETITLEKKIIKTNQIRLKKSIQIILKTIKQEVIKKMITALKLK